MNIKQKHIAAILGHVVADALGVPVEFKSRLELKENPVTDMLGYGTHHQPAGTWSDDSSMTIATLEWLGERKNGSPDYNALMDKICDWIMYGDYTPYGENFDKGIATAKALMNYGRGVTPLECGGKGDFDNGNGALMRILPVALWNSAQLCPAITQDGAQSVFEISALTYAHARSKVGCLIYAKVIADILYEREACIAEDSQKMNKMNSVQKSLSACKEYSENAFSKELTHEKETYARLWDVEAFAKLPS